MVLAVFDAGNITRDIRIKVLTRQGGHLVCVVAAEEEGPHPGLAGEVFEIFDQGPADALPLVGRIAAGRPIEAIPDQDEINLMDFFMGPNRFVLRVTGDSMIDAGILNGDMVIVEQRTHAGNNEIVVALIDNEEATLKSIKYNMDGTLTLTPANPRLKPVTYPAERVAIQGVVVGQMRSYR